MYRKDLPKVLKLLEEQDTKYLPGMAPPLKIYVGKNNSVYHGSILELVGVDVEKSTLQVIGYNGKVISITNAYNDLTDMSLDLRYHGKTVKQYEKWLKEKEEKNNIPEVKDHFGTQIRLGSFVVWSSSSGLKHGIVKKISEAHSGHFTFTMKDGKKASSSPKNIMVVRKTRESWRQF